MYKNKICKLMEDRFSVCPLKPNNWIKCRYDFECDIRREIKRDKKIEVILTEVKENAIL